MNLIKKLILSSNFWPIVFIFGVGLLAGRTLVTPGYFLMHDDLQMMRQLQMEKCFLDGQIPCRWVPDMGYGYGFPLFNFYPPLPYLIGEIFRIMGFSFVNTAKLTFLLSLIGSGIAMYFLAKEFFGRIGAIVAASFYIWAPYHAVDIFVRGAMNEAWALTWFPLILWTSYRLVKERKKQTGWIIGLALSWVALFTSHNLMVLIFAPVFAGWCLIFLLKEKKWRKIPCLIVSGIFSLILAAFFTIPALFEQKYVQVETLVIGYYEFIAHFASLGQLLFSRFWGYGPSVWGLEDRMSFQIGHIHWILSLVLIALTFNQYLKTRKLSEPLMVIGYFFLVGWFSAFMAHSRSTPIWLVIPLLKFVQFPWRFLTLTTLSFSLIAGHAVSFVKNKKTQKFLAAALIVILAVFNWNYFKPEKMGPLTDEEKFTGAAWELQQTAGIFDYLPKSAMENPREAPKALAEIVKGKGEIKNPRTGTNWAYFETEIASDKAEIRIGIFYFPNWKIFMDGEEIGHFIPEVEKWGRMYIEVPSGNHQIYLRLENTPIRTLANLISLFGWIGLASFLIVKKAKVSR